MPSIGTAKGTSVGKTAGEQTGDGPAVWPGDRVRLLGKIALAQHHLAAVLRNLEEIQPFTPSVDPPPQQAIWGGVCCRAEDLDEVLGDLSRYVAGGESQIRDRLLGALGVGSDGQDQGDGAAGEKADGPLPRAKHPLGEDAATMLALLELAAELVQYDPWKLQPDTRERFREAWHVLADRLDVDQTALAAVVRDLRPIDLGAAVQVLDELNAVDEDDEDEGDEEGDEAPVEAGEPATARAVS